MPEVFRYDVFLSHSSKDKLVARAIAQQLRDEGLRVWFDEWVIKPGDSIPTKIDEGLESSRVLVLLMSENAFGSDWTNLEVNTARFRDPLNKKQRFVPVRLDDSPIRGSLTQYHYISWRPGDRHAGIAKLCDACTERSDHTNASTSFGAPLGPSKSKGTASDGIPTVAIVGMGFSGTTTAIRLMNLASGPLKLLLFEHNPDQTFGGLAYGAGTLLKHHYLNIHAGRLSIQRERPDDFLKWATEDADRNEWFRQLAITDADRDVWEERLSFTEYSAVPRAIYKLYLRDRFREAQKVASPEVQVIILDSPIVDLDEYPSHVRLYSETKDGERSITDADVAVLCTGHLGPVVPDFLSEARGHDALFSNPYERAFAERVAESTKDDRLLIIGSGLSAYDAAIYAVETGYRGRITMCSRHGLEHAPYPQGHSHKILPPIFEDHFKDVRTADGMIGAMRSAISSAEAEFFSQYFPDERRTVIPERVMKAVEPQVARFTQNAKPGEVRRFLAHRSWITTRRTSVVPAVVQRVKQAGVRVERRSITSVDVASDRSLTVTFCDDSGDARSTEAFTATVCCMGFEADYSRPTGLWMSLMAKTTVAHFQTGLGIEVGNNGRVMRKKDMELSRSLYAVGTMRQGDEIQQRGRLGAFTFSIGTIRNQALMAALSILKNIELAEYRAIDEKSRRHYRQLVEAELGDTGPTRQSFNKLVAQLADAQFLPATPRRNEWVQALRMEIGKLVPSLRERQDSSLIEHEMWHTSRLRAGRIVTDIRQLSERYAIVRSYRPGTQNRCVKEKKECKDQLKRVMARLRASSASLSLYLADANCIFPFVDHLRLNRFLPTAYGAHNAGRLVRAFVERIGQEQLFTDDRFFEDGDIIPYYRDGRINGMVIPDYGHTSARKEIYDFEPRLYPHLIVALALDSSKTRVQGVLYLEASKEREFKESDVEEVVGESEHMAGLLERAISRWEPQQDLDRQDQDLTGLREQSGSDLRNINFTNATLHDADLSGAKLDRAILNGARCAGSVFENAQMRGAQLIGTKLADAKMAGADLSGTVIVASDLSRASLRGAVIDGATVERCRLSGADLSRAELAGTKMRNVDLSHVRLRHGRLLGLTLETCKWDNIDLSGCRMDQVTRQNLPEDVAKAFEGSFTLID
jgi:uncharacterized NAD(P)/FAD-binding protein YdhS